MAPEEGGTNEASRRAESARTGYTSLFFTPGQGFIQTCRYRPGVSALVCSFCCLFFLQAVSFEFAGLCRVRSLSRLSRARASALICGRPSRASCPLRPSTFRPGLSALRGLSPLPLRTFAGSLVSFERFAPCFQTVYSFGFERFPPCPQFL